MKRLCVMLVFCLYGSSACGPKITPIGPGNVYQPDEREKRLWTATKEQSLGIQGGGAIYYDPKLQGYVQSVLDRLLGNHKGAYLPLQPMVIFVDSPAVNAFAWPHGDIYVHTGILGRMRNEAQLAMLLGHEFAHSTHRHAYQELEHAYASTGAYSYIAVVSALGGSNIQRAMEGLSRMVMLAAISGYSRDKEAEADRVGLTLLAQAGYDPREGAKMFEKMEEAAEKDDSHWNFFYATHPKMASRARSATWLVDQLPRELIAQATEVGTDRYLDAAVLLVHEEVSRHIAQGKFELALATLNYLETNRTDDDVTLVLMGDLYRARGEDGDRDRCRAAYSKALELNANSAGAHKGLGFCLAREGEMAKAREHLTTFLRIAPSAVDAAYVRQYIDSLKGGQ